MTSIRPYRRLSYRVIGILWIRRNRSDTENFVTTRDFLKLYHNSEKRRLKAIVSDPRLPKESSNNELYLRGKSCK